MSETVAEPVPTSDGPGDAGRQAVARRPLRDRAPLALLRAAHPRQALTTGVGLAVVAALADRPTREALLVLATVVVGQVILGWHNDLVDRERDRRHQMPDELPDETSGGVSSGVSAKPVAAGVLDPGTVWFALTCAVLLLVPLAVSTGITAASYYLASLVVGLAGNVVLRRGLFSWVPWAVSFALYPAYLAYGGWGGRAVGEPPEPLVVVLFALLGIGVHFLRAIWGLVADHEDGWTYLPLRLGVRLGAARLLAVVSAYIGVVLVGLVLAGTYVGLAR